MTVKGCRYWWRLKVYKCLSLNRAKMFRPGVCWQTFICAEKIRCWVTSKICFALWKSLSLSSRQKYPLRSQFSGQGFENSQTSWIPASCIRASCGKWDYKHRNGDGSAAIHRLEDNRGMMNDEDEWRPIPPNVAQQKWIPRALLIISMSFPLAVFPHKSC